MPHLENLERADTRAAILRCSIDIFRTYYRAYFNDDDFGANPEFGFILFAVAIGQAEQRLMSASDISSFIGLSRATVSRKLLLLKQQRRLCSMQDGKRV